MHADTKDQLYIPAARENLINRHNPANRVPIVSLDSSSPPTARDMERVLKASLSEGDLNASHLQTKRSLFKSVRSRLEKGLSSLKLKTKAVTHNPLGEYPSPFSGRVLYILISPLVPVIVYALYSLFTNWIVFCYILFLCLHIAFMLAYAVTEIAIRPPWYHPQPKEKGLCQGDLPAYWQGISKDPRHDLGLDFEDVEFPTWGGLTLRGWLIKGAPDNPIALVCVHGGGLDRRSWLRHASFFHSEGYTALLFDMSGHGISDGMGRGFSYGVKEKDDVIAAAKFMKSKGYRVIIAVGTSVGGASVILAAAEDKTIDGIVSENPVSHAPQFASEHLQKMIANYRKPNRITNLLLGPFYRLTTFVFLFRIGSSLFSYKAPVDVIAKISPRPVLLMHGTSDDTVPCSHSERLYAAAKEPKSLWLAPEAWHCALYDKYPDEFQDRLRKYFREHFNITVVGNSTDDVTATSGRPRSLSHSHSYAGASHVNLLATSSPSNSVSDVNHQADAKGSTPAEASQ